eukprot:5990935-Prymnesium_polylepis.2
MAATHAGAVYVKKLKAIELVCDHVKHGRREVRGYCCVVAKRGFKGRRHNSSPNTANVTFDIEKPTRLPKFFKEIFKCVHSICHRMRSEFQCACFQLVVPTASVRACSRRTQAHVAADVREVGVPPHALSVLFAWKVQASFRGRLTDALGAAHRLGVHTVVSIVAMAEIEGN